MGKNDIYLYGMTLASTMNLLVGGYPEADTYSEIKESYVLPGGETGSCAVVLSSLGCTVKLDGNYQGPKTQKVLDEYLVRKFGIDMSGVYFDETFDGVQDMVLIGTNTRTCFGRFGAYFSNDIKRWNKPNRKDIESCEVVGLDPFFMDESEQVADYCHELGKKYVTIDCKYDTVIHKYSEVNILSNEFIKGNYPEKDIDELFKEYTANTEGLVIFTFGSREIMFGRRNQPIKRMKPYKVKVQSTLGAGDTFKAGAIYGVLKNMSDEKIVQFAAATAATVCSRFPLALYPPDLETINKLINN
ncbi:PfkB domain protein [Ruminiclostridium papyrosolvens DSM 2782]|uniref:PfkB domain protein n=1 Tax=Ruminiclostridium papyrosolvens DSM 2782 TaxID=588581 RepID=F1T7P0_9FIRM|nr:PfkB family carbohydrate kinase [Ruminiclostridium papyrosolvens]EGD49488.1 PfkB domain protein [Ruminiclostridium papyrosolvens DSM 2782]WES33387.1 PfkB family carbohydrate kinase [Ruminiclostridium papyrosolvens DSM 2782]